MNVTHTGDVLKKGNVREVNESFKIQKLLISTGDQYNPVLCVDFVNKGADMLETIQDGDTVTIEMNVYSRESTTKPNTYFTNVRGWRITKTQTDDTPAVKTAAVVEENNDLPF
tara:strand:+ start:3147 stop:3485 length:339 start_codon:yes stop_codon:yes gene_type:complete